MVSNNPICSPARATLLTGTYPNKNGVHCNVNSKSAVYGVELPANIVCWSDVLKEQGYSNGYIGKWHLDAPHQPYIPCKNNEGDIAWNEWTPFERRHGFDYWYSYGTYDYHDRPMYWDTKAPRDSFQFVNQWGPEHEADKAIDFFKNKGNVRNTSAPFSLVISINPPHEPYNTAPAKYHEPYNNIPIDSLVTDANIPPADTKMGDEYRKDVKNYYANITGVDAQIGRILQALKENKLLDNTIVLFTADHGNCLGKHNEHSKNNIYEESLRVPLLVYWKGRIKPCIDDELLISMPDIYPTLLDLAGYKKNIPATVDGKSYASYFLSRQGNKPSEQFILGALSYDQKQIKHSGFRSVRTKQYKLAYVTKKGGGLEPYLFNLQTDPFELNNIYRADHPMVKKLLPRLQYWLQKTGDRFAIP
ncbi:sulfatase [Chitinophagaceae bacterium LB-8]|uniref:Sulfatase n=1 Tax=Paraflavisolibacter caeni TaxID=2982496 RepID=A0A9X2Y181_9BACT|nr:sulfatase [Paraflavisolibacter caeni]MCU7552865.1 sulfatase [Paraflavisolibacter caeni]